MTPEVAAIENARMRQNMGYTNYNTTKRVKAALDKAKANGAQLGPEPSTMSKVEAILRKSPRPMTAPEIAKELGTTRQVVTSSLHGMARYKRATQTGDKGLRGASYWIAL
jgi:DNA-binding transcriptional regulator GbsR (MarR family)